jgi:hypothetical protein
MGRSAKPPRPPRCKRKMSRGHVPPSWRGLGPLHPGNSRVGAWPCEKADVISQIKSSCTELFSFDPWGLTRVARDGEGADYDDGGGDLSLFNSFSGFVQTKVSTGRGTLVNLKTTPPPLYHHLLDVGRVRERPDTFEIESFTTGDKIMKCRHHSQIPQTERRPREMLFPLDKVQSPSFKFQVLEHFSY